nr:MAG TPA: hypothetical protein [Caudoviricetes sp.]
MNGIETSLILLVNNYMIKCIFWIKLWYGILVLFRL